MDTVEEVARLVRQCQDCPLGRGRTNAVPGEGNPDAEIMFIGEGPGYHEDRLGRPFVGAAGKFLDDLLSSIGLTREQVFIANMVKCRPPQNRDPLPAEVSACNKYLERQIELVDPELIVTLGRFSLARFFPGESVSRARGKVRRKDGRAIYPIMHPAAGLHRQQFRPGIVEDFKGIPGALEEIRNSGVPEPPTLTLEPPPQQLSMFE